MTSTDLKTPDLGHRERRVADAASAISTLSDVYANNAVVFFKSLDNLLIGFGEPAGLRITDDSGPRLFETASGSDAECGPPLNPFDCDLRVALMVSSANPDRARIIRDGSAFIECVGQALLERHSDNLGRLCIALKDGFRQVCQEQASSELPSDAGEGVSDEDASRMLKPVFDRIEPFLLSRNHRFHLPHKPGQCRFLIFHRYIDLSGSPALRLHLLPSQKEALVAAGIDDVQQLLGKAFSTDRWLLDERFRTGVSTWIEWPWQRSGDGRLKDAERAISEVLFASDDLDGSAKLRSALAIPIHVDGVPWLALAGMFGAEEEAGNLWAQRFYRDLLPYLTTTIRAGAENAYLRAIRQSARCAAGYSDADAALITNKLATLAATFPFKRIVASFDATDASDALEWTGGARLSLDVGDIESDAPRVEYGRLSRSGILGAFRDARNEAEAERAQRLEAQLLTYMDVGHTLKNVVDCTGWTVSAGAVGNASKYFDDIVKAGFKPEDIAELEVALGFADRSLSLFWIMSSLGHFIRLSGAQTGTYGWGKFREWIDPDDVAIDTGDLKSDYVDAVTKIATALAYGNGWSNIMITRADGLSAQTWSGEPPDPLDITKLHLRPFRKGADIGYVFAFCLLEPLLNAIRAVGALSSVDVEKSDVTPLEILVSFDDADGTVGITIVNLSAKKLPPSLSGLRSARAIAAETGLATFMAPAEEAIGQDLYRITSGVSFHPQQIYDVISQARGAA